MNDYYQRHYRAYFEATADIDPEPFLGRFAGRLSIGDRCCGFMMSRAGFYSDDYDNNDNCGDKIT